MAKPATASPRTPRATGGGARRVDVEALEDRADAKAVAEALAEQGDKPADSWDKVKAELGIA